MADAALVWSGDLALNTTGDLSMVAGAELTQQRVLRRLLTNPHSYIWHSDYGGALGAFVGSTAGPHDIEGVLRRQLYLEAAVGRHPEPVITTNRLSDGGIFVDLAYADGAVASPQSLTFSVGA